LMQKNEFHFKDASLLMPLRMGLVFRGS